MSSEGFSFLEDIFKIDGVFVIHDSLSSNSCLGNALTNVVCIFDTFEKNIKTKYQFRKIFEGNLFLDRHFPKCLQKDSHVYKIFSKQMECLLFTTHCLPILAWGSL